MSIHPKQAQYVMPISVDYASIVMANLVWQIASIEW